jgi:hypothetical protein
MREASSGRRFGDSLYALARANNLDQAIVAESMRLCGHDFDLDMPMGATDVADLPYAPMTWVSPNCFSSP